MVPLQLPSLDNLEGIMMRHAKFGSDLLNNFLEQVSAVIN